MNSPRTRFYRDKVDGKILGVCAGIGDYTGVNPLWVRLAAVIAVMTPPLAAIVIPAYLLIGLLASKKPAHLYADVQEQKFWQGVRQSPTRTAREVRTSFREIDRRLAEVESHYVSSNPRLSAEIDRLR